MLLVLLIELGFVKEVEIFPNRYCGSLQVNWMQSCKLSKMEDDPIVRESNLGRTRVVRGGPAGRIFFKPPSLTACNFDALLLCPLLAVQCNGVQPSFVVGFCQILPQARPCILQICHSMMHDEVESIHHCLLDFFQLSFQVKFCIHLNVPHKQPNAIDMKNCQSGNILKFVIFFMKLYYLVDGR